ncbi:MAG TPA: DUF4178 domain-containing protein [Polyangiaceae bacterium]|nr:DUF4178 domain-containing protein [Polyangiaceae bacterium]
MGRDEQGLRDLGLVAERVGGVTHLGEGMRGNHQGSGFRISKRETKESNQGARWDEWLCTFDDGRVGWLAEGRGQAVLYFERTPTPALRIAPDARVVSLGELGELTILERGSFRVVPRDGFADRVDRDEGESIEYAELVGSNGAVASVELAGAVARRVFVGQRCSWQELGLDGSAVEAAPEEGRVQVIRCECGGLLPCTFGDATLGCPYCGALTELENHAVQAVRAAQRRSRATAPIPLRARGELLGRELEVVGYVVKRAGLYSSSWREYALLASDGRIHWLSEADGHYCFFRETKPFSGLLPLTENEGGLFHRSSGYEAEIIEIRGALPWRARLGDTSRVTEYFAAPYCLSSEETASVDGGRSFRERSYFRGEYVASKLVHRAFGGEAQVTLGVHPAQPNPYPNLAAHWFGLAMGTLLLFLGFLIFLGDPSTTLQAETYEPIQASGEPVLGVAPAALYTSQPIHLEAGKNIILRVAVRDLQGYLGLDGEFVRADGGAVIPAELSVEHYSGLADGYAWEEGSEAEELRLSATEGGTFVYRAHLTFVSDPDHPMPSSDGRLPLRIVVTQGSPSGLLFFALQLALLPLPITLMVLRHSFEQKRRGGGDSV